MSETNKPAFPRSRTDHRGDISSDYVMTLREYYAGLAMHGLLSEGGQYTDPSIGAQLAVDQADALIDALQEAGDDD